MQVHDADLFLAPIRRVHLPGSGNEFEAGNAGETQNRLHDLVRAHVDHIQDSWTEMSREQKMILVVDRQIVEALSRRARQIEFRYLSQGLAAGAESKRRDQQKERSSPESDFHQPRRALYFSLH